MRLSSIKNQQNRSPSTSKIQYTKYFSIFQTFEIYIKLHGFEVKMNFEKTSFPSGCHLCRIPLVQDIFQQYTSLAIFDNK